MRVKQAQGAIGKIYGIQLITAVVFAGHPYDVSFYIAGKNYEAYYMLNDHLGSSSHVTNSASAACQHMEYYNRAIRIKCSPTEDAIAYAAAKAQASKGTYCIMGISCLDVAQEALQSVVIYRLNQEHNSDKSSLTIGEYYRYGFSALEPNAWYSGLLRPSTSGGNFLEAINRDLKNKLERMILLSSTAKTNN